MGVMRIQMNDVIYMQNVNIMGHSRDNKLDRIISYFFVMRMFIQLCTVNPYRGTRSAHN